MATFDNGEAGLSVRTKLNDILQHADGTETTLTFNDAGADVDFRVEGVGQTHALFLDAATSNVGVGTATTSSKLTVAGDVTASGVSTAVATRDSTNRRIVAPGGGSYTTTTATVTGAIAVTLPVGYTNHMSRFTIKVFEYVTQESFEVVIAGYNNAATPAWVNCSAYIVSSNATDRDYTIRFGFNSTSSRCVVYVGELASTWSYPQVNITDVQLGYGTSGLDAWDTDWSIAFEPSAFQNVTVTLTNTRVGARLFGAGQLTAALTDAGARSDILRLSSSSTSAGGGGGIVFTTQQADTVNSLGMAAIKGILTSGTTNTTGDLAFSTRNAVTDTALTERMRITSGGDVYIGSTAGRVGSTVTPRLQLEGTTTAQSTTMITRNSADVNSGGIFIAKSRGTAVGAATVVASGDQIGTINFYGADGTGLIPAAFISAHVDGTPGTNDMPGRLQFSTTADGAATPTERLRITSTGLVSIAGSFGRGGIVTKTTSFTLADTEDWIICNGTGTITVTFPAASAWTGREVMIKNIAAFTVVSASSNVVPINSATAGTAILPGTAGSWATLVSNGTNWVIMQS
jgi:hypothetical protein